MNTECTDYALEKLKKAGLDKRIEEFDFYDLVYGGYFNSKKDMRIIEKARKFVSNIRKKDSDRYAVFRDILDLKDEVEDEGYFSSDFNKKLIKHPGIMGYYLLKDDLFDAKKFKFPSSMRLAEAIAGYYFGEVRVFREAWIWRTKGIKNEVIQTMHGDLSACQSNVSGWHEKDFFNHEDFEAIKKDAFTGSISAYQDFSIYLLSALKYAEFLGKARIPEIRNWKEVMKETCQIAGAYTEAMFGREHYFDLEFMFEAPLLSDKKIEMWPLHIPSQYSSAFYPYIKNNNLLFYAETKKEGETLTDLRHFEGKKFIKCLEYCEKDLTEILKANYKLFAREKGKMYTIMEMFNEKHKGD